MHPLLFGHAFWALLEITVTLGYTSSLAFDLNQAVLDREELCRRHGTSLTIEIRTLVTVDVALLLDLRSDFLEPLAKLLLRLFGVDRWLFLTSRLEVGCSRGWYWRKL